MIEALDIHITGIVQGVGFRPFVYRTAQKHQIKGWVLNAIDGVFIHAEAEAQQLDSFVIDLSENPPAAAQVKEIELKEVPLEHFETFEIRFSDDGEAEETTLVSPDLATCSDCVSELFDPADRRYRYPFINCTNCGPRFTIIDHLPYDRPATSMAKFPMCPTCAAEYEDPADRRFHAQPDACFDCGPHISWREHKGGDIAAPLGEISWGTTREKSDALFARAVEVLCAGGILAVKGLGGFHLVCDANNAEAVAKLRARKHREGKAFAVMMASVEDVQQLCEVNDEEKLLLTGAQRPIVLLKKQTHSKFVPLLADKLPELGVMLPYTPVQHLLMHDFVEAQAKELAANVLSASVEAIEPTSTANPPMLVMTSGNLHDEPIATGDEEAYERLFSIADAFLGNNREILSRYDDSVVRVIRAGSAGDVPQIIRRARGYSPVPIQIDIPDAQQMRLFAAGSEQKNTFTLLRSTEGEHAEAFVSQHIGDVENAETFDAWLDAKQRYEKLFEIKPDQLVCDMHPEYLTTKWVRDQEKKIADACAGTCSETGNETDSEVGNEVGAETIAVQHHFAHIASVIGEHGLADAVCGFAFDGTGYGVDGAIWGGEVLLANQTDFERFANFTYVPMPGGAAAIKNPLRMAYGALWTFDLLEHPAAQTALAALGEQAQLCDQMIERSINTPLTSSVGRLFDAASALLGVCTKPTYEGESAILLEAAMGKEANAVVDEREAAEQVRYSLALIKNTATASSTAHDTSVLLLDAAPAFAALLDDVKAKIPVPVIARRFHNAFVEAILNIAEIVRGLYGISTVALSGGVFMNRYLIEHVVAALEQAGFTAAVNRDLPPNDGCISFGQAVVAWARNKA